MIKKTHKDLVICGGTDKSIEVFDMNTCQSSLAIHEAHSRTFNQSKILAFFLIENYFINIIKHIKIVLQNESEFNEMSYDIFLTNAIGDGVKVWFFIFVISSLFYAINRNYNNKSFGI